MNKDDLIRTGLHDHVIEPPAPSTNLPRRATPASPASTPAGATTGVRRVAGGHSPEEPG